MLWSPQRKWEGQDAYLIGGGASLRSFDFNRLKGLNTIGCNDAFRLGGDIIQYCIFGDASWFHRTKIELGEFKNPIVSVAPSLLALPTPMLCHMKRQRAGIHSGTHLGWNYSTGATAINLAISLGAKRIFLLGYDCNLQNGQSHWHERRPAVTREAIFQRFIKGFKDIADCLPPLQVTVVHVLDGESRLPFFWHMGFEVFHQHLGAQFPHCEMEEVMV
jgi:hypothetical protein